MLRRSNSKVLPGDESATPLLSNDPQELEQTKEGLMPLSNESKVKVGDPGPLVKKKYSQINLFWSEKGWIIIECFQIYALFWVAGVTWPMPLSWQRFTSFTLLTNLDFLTLLHFLPSPAKHRSTVVRTLDTPFGQEHMDLCTLGMGMFWAAAVLLPYLVFRWTGKRALMETRPWHGSSIKARWERRLDRLWRFAYVPATLAAGRITVSSPDYEWAGSTCATVPTWGAMHVACIVAMGPVMTLFAVGVPLRTWQRARQSILFQEPERHEQFLKRREMEHCLGLSNEYMLAHVNLVSSFHRAQAMWPVWAYVRKLAIVILVVCFAHLPHIAGTGILLVSFMVFVRQLFTRRFRCKSSQWIFMAFEACFVYNIFLGSLKANRIQSAISVDSVLVQWLVVVNLCAASLLAVYVSFLFYRRHWHKEGHEHWPVPIDDITQFLGGDEEKSNWMNQVSLAKEALMAANQALPELYPIHIMERHALKISKVWRKAHNVGCPLAGTFSELVEDMQLGLQHHEGISAMVSEEAENLLSYLATRMHLRGRQTILMRPSKKAILFKLLVLKTWLGNRKVRKLDGYISKNSQEIEMEVAQTNVINQQWGVSTFAEVKVAASNLVRTYQRLILMGKDACESCDKLTADGSTAPMQQLLKLEQVREELKKELQYLVAKPDWGPELVEPSKEHLLQELKAVVSALGDRVVSAMVF